jgi:repressor LexA
VLDKNKSLDSVRANMDSLTERQQEVLSFIQEEHARYGVPPSTREIQRHFEFASQTAALNHLRALERKGAIQRRRGKARAVSVVSELPRGRIVDVPIYGRIAAGLAETIEQEADGVLSLDAASAGIGKKSRVFALKVRGDSMIGAQINDGDTVVLEKREPRDGDIVAALIDGETTLKRYVVSDGKPYLHAENPRFRDLIPARELIVQGVVTTLVRRIGRSRPAS